MFTKLSEKNTDKILINCLIIDPKTNYQKQGEIIIKDGKIFDFGPNVQKKIKSLSKFEIIDCNNHIVCPGLIDIQVHFRDPGQTNKEDIISGSKSAAAGGITSVVCQPNTIPVIDNMTIIDYLKFKAKSEAYCNIYAYGAITKNMKGELLSEMANMSQSDIIVGFTDDGLPVENANIMRVALQYSKTYNKVIAQHAEDMNLSNGGCINEGKISQKLGVKGIPNISESVIVARDIELARETGGKYHVLHVSAKESIEHIKIAKKEGLLVTAEVTPHHLLLNESEVLKSNTNAKMNPPLRSQSDRLALIEALKDGTIDAIATDHAPHNFELKDTSLSNAAFGIVGTETMLCTILELYHNKTIPLIELLKKVTCNPAKIINIDRGEIKKGKIADLAVIDINKEWIINPSEFYSKSRNTPFINRKVKGKVMKTFLSGKLIYSL